MKHLSKLMLVSVLACWGCAGGTLPPGGGANDAGGLEKISVSGVYVAAFEVKWFSPDGIDERWWLSDPLGLIDPGLRMANGLFGGVAELVVEGVLSTKGDFGHLGQYDRNFEVTAVKRFKRLPADPKNIPVHSGDPTHGS